METLKLGLRFIAAVIAVLAILLIQSQIDGSESANTTVCTTRNCV